ARRSRPLLDGKLRNILSCILLNSPPGLAPGGDAVKMLLRQRIASSCLPSPRLLFQTGEKWAGEEGQPLAKLWAQRYNGAVGERKPIALRVVKCALEIGMLGALAGCGRSQAPPPPVSAPPARVAPAVPQEPLPLWMSREALTESLLESLRKRVMGRREALRDVARIATEIGPIVADAARQPQAEAGLRRMALESGMTFAEARAQWIALQEADLLLESGGDPDAVSPSQAVGVAQWLAGTANANGLPVNLKESRRLSAKIVPLKWKIAWCAYLTGLNADPAAPGAPLISPAEAAAQLPALRSELEMLRAKRRRADARYDPRKAIFAQTRYLLRLYPRFPSPDWLFQAYHGGEAGVQRTLRKYLGNAWPGSSAAAIRFGRHGQPLRYEDLYFSTTPRARRDAFAYLYGRSDDHRYYWWKLRASQEVIALYRRDPAAFQRQWEAFFPGRSKEAVWYPDAPAESLADLAALQAACASRRLVPVGP